MTEPINALLEFGRVTYDLLERFVVAHERIASALERGAGSSPTSSRPQGAAVPAATAGSGARFRFGKRKDKSELKGTLLADGEINEVRSAAHYVVRTWNPSGQYHASNVAHLAELNAEIVRRGSTPIEYEPPKATTMLDDEPPPDDRPGAAPSDTDVPF